MLSLHAFVVVLNAVAATEGRSASFGMLNALVEAGVHQDVAGLIENVRHLATALIRAAAANDAIAEEAAAIASTLGQHSPDLIAQELRELQRHHTIKAMETRGRLAALTTRYSGLLGDSE